MKLRGTTVLFPLFIVTLAGFTTSCDTALDREAYLTPVAQARANGLEIYWLGPSFQAGGKTYSYIEGTYPQGVSGARVKALELVYGTGRSGELRLSINTVPLGEGRRRKVPFSMPRTSASPVAR